MDMQKPPKRRKLTDKNVPNAILQSPEFSVDSQLYMDLLAMEKKLDWTMTRKRVEVQDTLGRPMTVSTLTSSYHLLHVLSGFSVLTSVQHQTTRTLRLFLSHTVSGQPWQQGDASAGGNVNVETGEGIPAFQFKVEGRLLEVHTIVS